MTTVQPATAAVRPLSDVGRAVKRDVSWETDEQASSGNRRALAESGAEPINSMTSSTGRNKAKACLHCTRSINTTASYQCTVDINKQHSCETGVYDEEMQISFARTLLMNHNIKEYCRY